MSSYKLMRIQKNNFKALLNFYSGIVFEKRLLVPGFVYYDIHKILKTINTSPSKEKNDCEITFLNTKGLVFIPKVTKNNIKQTLIIFYNRLNNI